MAKLTLADLANLQNETSAVNTINANSALIETAIENTLTRNGALPNRMESDFDMNSYRIINLPAPINMTEPLRLRELQDLLDAINSGSGGGVAVLLPNSVTNAILTDMPGDTIKARLNTAGDPQDISFSTFATVIGPTLFAYVPTFFWTNKLNIGDALTQAAQDTQINLRRTYPNGYDSGASHGFYDSTLINDSEMYYNSFGTGVKHTGTNTGSTHMIGFQAFMEYDCIGGTLPVMLDFSSSPSVDNGTVGIMAGFVSNAPLITGTGHINTFANVTINSAPSSATIGDSYAILCSGGARSRFSGPLHSLDAFMGKFLRTQEFTSIGLTTVGAGVITTDMILQGKLNRTGTQVAAFTDTLPSAVALMDAYTRVPEVVTSSRLLYFRNNTTGGFTQTIGNSGDGSFIVAGAGNTIAAGKVGIFEEIVANSNPGVSPSQLQLRRLGTMDL